MKKWVYTFGLIVLSALAVCWCFKTKQFDRYGHERFDLALRRLKQIDTTFSEEVLKARFRIVENYDDFPRYAHDLAELTEELKNVPDFVGVSGKSRITGLLGDYSSLLQKRAEMFEEFKSQNAVLNNSLKYFPVAGEELVGLVADQGNNNELENGLNDLLRKVMIYSATPEEGPEGIRQCIEKIKEWQNRHPKDPNAPLVSSLLMHARTIRDRKPKVDGLTRSIVLLPTTEKIEDIYHIYQTDLTHALNVSNFYRALFYALAIAFVVGVAFALARLRASKQSLERRVHERTMDLSQTNEKLRQEMAQREQLQSQLLRASHMAGMAEVATGILHNVGNILNSVNISTGVILERVVRSKATNIQKMATLLNGQTDLGSFFCNDPRAKKVPGYLMELAAQIEHEQQTVKDEVQNLQKNIDHIKDIVAMQQSFAKVSGVRETVAVQDLVEEALRLNASSLARHNLNIVRNFSTTPKIQIEKHKVLQILVNLLTNAKQACEETTTPEKKITLQITSNDETVNISVIDNGVGIPAEKLTEIFNHGFTTKKNGHGFGLHSSALAAKEMGGLLSAHSEGPERGAMFTLALPLRPAEEGLAQSGH